jgi:hypothetical protein
MMTRNSGPGRAGIRSSGVVMSVFAVAWWLTGATALRGAARPTGIVLGMALGMTFVILVGRYVKGSGEPAGYQRNANRFTVVNVIQVFAIVVVTLAANKLDAAAWIPGLIAVVVGVHFLPLAALFGWPEYRWTGALLILAGVVGALAAAFGSTVDTTRLVVGIGCAAVLWGSALWPIHLDGRRR